MPDPVVTPAPSTVTPVVAPVAPVVAPAAVIDPAAPVVAQGDPLKPVDAPKPAVAPESYDFSKVELPKGVELNADLVAAVSPVFKKHNLTQEAAAELVKTHADALAKADAAGEVKRDADFKEFMKAKVTENQAALNKEWGAEAPAKLAIAQAGMAKVVSPAMKAILDDTGLGSHPEFVKAFYQVGLMSREDTPPNVVQPSNSGKSAAQALYGSTTPPH